MPELQLTVEDRLMLRELDAAFAPAPEQEHAACARAIASAARSQRYWAERCALVERHAAVRVRRAKWAFRVMWAVAVIALWIAAYYRSLVK